MQKGGTVKRKLTRSILMIYYVSIFLKFLYVMSAVHAASTAAESASAAT